MATNRKIKNVDKSFREYNIRQKGLDKPILTLNEYLNLKLPIDHLGRIHPKMNSGEIHMLQVFGESIYTNRKECIKCRHTKPYADFICRYKTKRIENICKMCERKRHHKLKSA